MQLWRKQQVVNLKMAQKKVNQKKALMVTKTRVVEASGDGDMNQLGEKCKGKECMLNAEEGELALYNGKCHKI
jgi:hypothetical protein